MSTFVNLILFFVIIGGLATIHETGHFLAAKLTKAKIAEFGLGLPPKLFKLFTWQGTDFTLNLIPFGAFVRPEVPEGVDPTQADMLADRSPLQKIFVFVSGPLFNIVVGIIFCGVLVSQMGVPIQNQIKVVDVSANSPAERANLKVGDIITAVDQKPIADLTSFKSLVSERKGDTVTLNLLRNGETTKIEVTPRTNPAPGEGALGVIIGNPYRKSNGAEIVQNTWVVSSGLITEMASLPLTIFSGHTENNRLIGFKGMFDLFDSAAKGETLTVKPPAAPAENSASPVPAPKSTPEPDATTKWLKILQYIIVITFGLGITNLFPLPALDGGRIVFVLIGIIFRKPVPVKVEVAIHTIGYYLLLGLMVYITVMDFVNPII